MQLKIEKGTFKDYSLEDISDALRKGLSENFKNVEVEVVDCPNLRDWDCPSEGISGNQKIIDVGGEPYMHDPKFIGAEFDYEEISKMRPSGLILSPGPGDPSLLDSQIDIAKHLLGQIPMMGICLGHQIIARAFGAETFKMKFGHRGGNHPVKDESSDRIYITSQNHGYAVDFKNLPADLVVSHTILNYGTIEGLAHKDLPIMSIQYHSEASPGPLDNIYLFDKFISKVENYWNNR